MIHLIWGVPTYVLIGIFIARISMKVGALDSEKGACVALIWPLFIPAYMLLGIFDGVRIVLEKMEERSHDNR